LHPTARLLVPALVLALTVVAGCDAGPPRPGQQAAGATATPTATELPSDAPIPEAFRGLWTSDLSSGSQSHGLWHLRIGAGEMELLNPKAKDETEYFRLHARAATDAGVSFYTDPDCDGASYQWALAGDELTFTPMGIDPCPDRWSTLASQPWHRVPSS